MCGLFFCKFLEDISPFMWDHFFDFLVTSQDGFLRFTFGAIPDLLVANMAVTSFYPHTCIQALVGIKCRIKCAIASQHVRRQTLYRLNYASSFLRRLFSSEVSFTWPDNQNSLTPFLSNKIS